MSDRVTISEMLECVSDELLHTETMCEFHTAQGHKIWQRHLEKIRRLEALKKILRIASYDPDGFRLFLQQTNSQGREPEQAHG